MIDDCKPAHFFANSSSARIYKFIACKLHNSLFLSVPKENCVNATELPFNTLQNFVCCLAIYRLCSQIFFGWTKLWRKTALQANYCSIRHEISCELLSKLSLKNHGNKGRNSCISLALLLHNTVYKAAIQLPLHWSTIVSFTLKTITVGIPNEP